MHREPLKMSLYHLNRNGSMRQMVDVSRILGNSAEFESGGIICFIDEIKGMRRTISSELLRGEDVIYSKYHRSLGDHYI